MLEGVDFPVCVQKHDGIYDPQIDMPKLIRADGIGPEGWNNALIELLPRIRQEHY
jgi:mannosyl-3-phosphoglycerate phosphatase